MYVCVCHAVTDRDIREEVERGACSLFDVQCRLPVASCCGRCEETARQVIDEIMDEQVARAPKQPSELKSAA
jgi:bacterioferritin-associated ferredoxin